MPKPSAARDHTDDSIGVLDIGPNHARLIARVLREAVEAGTLSGVEDAMAVELVAGLSEITAAAD